MKKLISILACIAMLMALATSAFAAGIPLGGGTGSEIEEITTFKAKVDALPEEITLECKDAIEAAEAALAALKLKLGRNWEFGGAKAMAEWVTKLENARADYDALVAGGGNNDAETPDTPAGGGNADKPAGGDNADKPAGGDNVDTPTEPETPVEPEQPDTPVEPEQPNDPIAPTGDYTFVVFAMMVLSMTAIVVLVSKKRAF